MSESNSKTNKRNSRTTKSSWLKEHWRPAMAWSYLITIIFDFVVFPILWGILQYATHATVSQWQPITLQSNGFYHLTMCAVLGVAAYGRTQEKIAGADATTKKADDASDEKQ